MNTPIDEIAKKGQELYDTKLKTKLEKRFYGKYAAIDVESGEYFIGDTLVDALTKAKTKFPSQIFHSVKIGSTGAFTMSGLNRKRNEALLGMEFLHKIKGNLHIDTAQKIATVQYSP